VDGRVGVAKFVVIRRPRRLLYILIRLIVFTSAAFDIREASASGGSFPLWRGLLDHNAALFP
jgi:hypothetical protein